MPHGSLPFTVAGYTVVYAYGSAHGYTRFTLYGSSLPHTLRAVTVPVGYRLHARLPYILVTHSCSCRSGYHVYYGSGSVGYVHAFTTTTQLPRGYIWLDYAVLPRYAGSLTHTATLPPAVRLPLPVIPGSPLPAVTRFPLRLVHTFWFVTVAVDFAWVTPLRLHTRIAVTRFTHAFVGLRYTTVLLPVAFTVIYIHRLRTTHFPFTARLRFTVRTVRYRWLYAVTARGYTFAHGYITRYYGYLRITTRAVVRLRFTRCGWIGLHLHCYAAFYTHRARTHGLRSVLIRLVGYVLRCTRPHTTVTAHTFATLPATFGLFYHIACLRLVGSTFLHTVHGWVVILGSRVAVLRSPVTLRVLDSLHTFAVAVHGSAFTRFTFTVGWLVRYLRICLPPGLPRLLRLRDFIVPRWVTLRLRLVAVTFGYAFTRLLRLVTFTVTAHVCAVGLPVTFWLDSRFAPRLFTTVVPRCYARLFTYTHTPVYRFTTPHTFWILDFILYTTFTHTPHAPHFTGLRLRLRSVTRFAFTHATHAHRCGYAFWFGLHTLRTLLRCYFITGSGYVYGCLHVYAYIGYVTVRGYHTVIRSLVTRCYGSTFGYVGYRLVRLPVTFTFTTFTHVCTHCTVYVGYGYAGLIYVGSARSRSRYRSHVCRFHLHRSLVTFGLPHYVLVTVVPGLRLHFTTFYTVTHARYGWLILRLRCLLRLRVPHTVATQFGCGYGYAFHVTVCAFAVWLHVRFTFTVLRCWLPVTVTFTHVYVTVWLLHYAHTRCYIYRTRLRLLYGSHDHHIHVWLPRFTLVTVYGYRTFTVTFTVAVGFYVALRFHGLPLPARSAFCGSTLHTVPFTRLRLPLVVTGLRVRVHVAFGYAVAFGCGYAFYTRWFGCLRLHVLRYTVPLVAVAFVGWFARARCARFGLRFGLRAVHGSRFTCHTVVLVTYTGLRAYAVISTYIHMPHGWIHYLYSSRFGYAAFTPPVTTPLLLVYRGYRAVRYRARTATLRTVRFLLRVTHLYTVTHRFTGWFACYLRCTVHYTTLPTGYADYTAVIHYAYAVRWFCGAAVAVLRYHLRWFPRLHTTLLHHTFGCTVQLVLRLRLRMPFRLPLRSHRCVAHVTRLRFTVTGYAHTLLHALPTVPGSTLHHTLRLRLPHTLRLPFCAGSQFYHGCRFFHSSTWLLVGSAVHRSLVTALRTRGWFFAHMRLPFLLPTHSCVCTFCFAVHCAAHTRAARFTFAVTHLRLRTVYLPVRLRFFTRLPVTHIPRCHRLVTGCCSC